MINATYFTYDGVFSGQYGLQIADFTGLTPDSVEENEAFSPSLSVLKVPSLMRFYHGGIEYDSAPTCEFSVVSEGSIPVEMRGKILSWLIGRREFKKLTFHNYNGWEDFSYYCVFTGSSTIYVNGECHGFRLTATFDSPFARGEPTVAHLASLGSSGSAEVVINNKSNLCDSYTYPIVKFVGEDITIINTDDSPTRSFSFNGLQAGEAMTVDCETHIINSSIGGEKLSNFYSKKWLRLRQGSNHLQISSNNGVTNVDIICPWYVMIGY